MPDKNFGQYITAIKHDIQDARFGMFELSTQAERLIKKWKRVMDRYRGYIYQEWMEALIRRTAGQHTSDPRQQTFESIISELKSLPDMLTIRIEKRVIDPKTKKENKVFVTCLMPWLDFKLPDWDNHIDYYVTSNKRRIDNKANNKRIIRDSFGKLADEFGADLTCRELLQKKTDQFKDKGKAAGEG